MKGRRESILRAIIRQFIETAAPVGSKTLHDEKGFNVSAATIRNEMALLEKEGFLEHPHTSAGRIPTTKGYRFHLEEMQVSPREQKKAEEQFSEARKKYYAEKMADERVFDTVSILTKITPNIAFATVPSAKRTFFLGLSNVLQEPEFSQNSQLASKIVKVLEEDFYNLLERMDMTEEISVFIGSENLLEDFEACSLMAFRFDILGNKGNTIGILGPMRMPYKRNLLALQATRKFLDEKLLQ